MIDKLREIEERWADRKISTVHHWRRKRPKWTYTQFKPFGAANFIVTDEEEPKVIAEVHWLGIDGLEAISKAPEDVKWLIERVKILETELASAKEWGENPTAER
jgi:hypothetical protein